MTPFRHIPLGARIPDRTHAVSCSLPTMRDVIGYEEKEARTLARMSSGYPRFVVHPLIAAIADDWRRRFGLGNSVLWIVSSRRMAAALGRHLAPAPARLLAHDGLHGIAHPPEPDLGQRAKTFLQHVGGFLSSRAAEDYGVGHGLAPAPDPEDVFPGDAAAEVRRAMARLLAPVAPGDILLTPSGMNAFWSTFQAVGKHQRAAGRDTWLQVGWLYLDTAAILAKFTGGHHLRVFDVGDREAIEAAFRDHGPRIAGVVTEVTTNPLMQTPDLPWLAKQARAHGAFMLVDPSIVSPYNVDVVPHADIVLNSLTKYAAGEGDVIAGLVALTPDCPQREAVRRAIEEEMEPVYPRDIARLARQIGGYEALVDQLNANARVVIEHLAARPSGIRRLYWSLQPGSRENYLRVARAPDRVGPMLSLEVDGPVERFFDAVPIAKGPSFGMRTTLLCPFVYLAHYDLVTSEEGRRLLREARLPPNLLRLSIGAEPPEALIDALEAGFAAAGHG